MPIVEIYKPSFEAFHEKPVIVFQEPKGPVRIAVNLFHQYNNWLNAWTDAFGRDKHAPAPAFWESGGPQICRALRSLPACVGLFFEWESDRKVAYRWITRKLESPVAYSNDWYCICPIKGEITKSGEGRVTVTLPTDEDVSFYWNASTMKEWLKQKPSEERATNACEVCGEHHKLEPLKPKSRVKTKVDRVEVGHDYNRSVPMGAIGLIKEWSQYGTGSAVSVRVEFDLKDKHGDVIRHNYMPCELEILSEQKP